MMILLQRLWFLHQNVLVILLVVLVVESHDTPHERMVGIFRFSLPTFFIYFERHHNRLLNEVSCIHDSVSVKFLKIFKFSDSVQLSERSSIRNEVWVSRTVLDSVAHFFAADAFYVLEHDSVHLFLLV